MKRMPNIVNLHRFDAAQRACSFHKIFSSPIIDALKSNTTDPTHLDSAIHINPYPSNSINYIGYQWATIDLDQITLAISQTLLDGTFTRLNKLSHLEIENTLSGELLTINHYRNFPLKFITS